MFQINLVLTLDFIITESSISLNVSFMFPKKYDHKEIESKIQKLYEKYQLAEPDTVVQMQSDLGVTFPC